MSNNKILCDSYCPICGSRMTLDLLCSGDYFETDTNVILLKTCSNDACGIQDPPVKGFDPMYLSKRKKKRIGHIYADRYNKDYQKVKERTSSIETNNKKVFAKEFSKIFQIPFNEAFNLTR